MYNSFYVDEKKGWRIDVLNQKFILVYGKDDTFDYSNFRSKIEVESLGMPSISFDYEGCNTPYDYKFTRKKIFFLNLEDAEMAAKEIKYRLKEFSDVMKTTPYY